MKKIIKLLILSLSSIVTLFLLVAISINLFRLADKNTDTFDYLENSSNKVILFIGDGMGQNHIKNTELFLDKKLFFTSIDKMGTVNTYSKNTFWPTDSAASATAMATGKKVYNTFVASNFGKPIKSISEYVKEKNMGVGIVTTDTLAGATPSSFSAHALRRSHTEDIIETQLNNNIDLYLGAGNQTYLPYKSRFEEKGYSFIQKYSELPNTKTKVLGSFSTINNYEHTDEAPTLPMLTKYAIDYFEKHYPEGYFLMIEGAHIDKSNHSNNIDNMIKYLDEFDNSIELAFNMLSEENVAFIITADHESGNLDLANSKSEITNDLYQSSDHTAKDVYYFIYHKNNYEINKIPNNIDNTDIFEMIKKILGI